VKPAETIGVVIPAHDAASTIDAALASVAAQTEPPFSTLVVADACGDDTAARARVTDAAVIELGARSPGTARNAGVAATQTDWIAFLDADDLWRPGWLAAVREAMARFPDVDLYFGTWEEQSFAGQRLSGPERSRPTGDIFEALLCENFIATPAVVVRRQRFLKSGGFDEQLPVSEDWDLWLRLATHHRFYPVYGEHVVVRRVFPSATRNPVRIRDAGAQGLEVLQRAMARRPVDPALRRRALAHHFGEIAQRRLAHGLHTDARADLRRALDLEPWRWRLWVMALLSALPPTRLGPLLRARRALRGHLATHSSASTRGEEG